MIEFIQILGAVFGFISFIVLCALKWAGAFTQEIPDKTRSRIIDLECNHVSRTEYYDLLERIQSMERFHKITYTKPRTNFGEYKRSL